MMIIMVIEMMMTITMMTMMTTRDRMMVIGYPMMVQACDSLEVFCKQRIASTHRAIERVRIHNPHIDEFNLKTVT